METSLPNIQTLEAGSNYGKFVIEPLERGGGFERIERHHAAGRGDGDRARGLSGGVGEELQRSIPPGDAPAHLRARLRWARRFSRQRQAIASAAV